MQDRQDEQQLLLSYPTCSTCVPSASAAMASITSDTQVCSAAASWVHRRLVMAGDGAKSSAAARADASACPAATCGKRTYRYVVSVRAEGGAVRLANWLMNQLQKGLKRVRFADVVKGSNTPGCGGWAFQHFHRAPGAIRSGSGRHGL